MSDTHRNDDEISLFGIAATLLRHRWRMVRWMLFGATLSVAPIAFAPPKFEASASFVPLGADAGRSGLSSLAGQFGISLPSSSQTQTPDFYVKLLRSRDRLSRVAQDSFAISDSTDKVPFVKLFRISEGSPAERTDEAVKRLGEDLQVAVDRPTGVVKLSISTKWPKVSLELVAKLVDEVNAFNRESRKGQANAERRLIEGRIPIVEAELRESETKLSRFLENNKQYASSATLALERERLQRDVLLRTQVYTSLKQGYEDARIREARDAPIISMIEVPSARTVPMPRGRTKRAEVGLLLGGILCLFSIFVTEMIAHRRSKDDADLYDFIREAKVAAGPLVGLLQRGRALLK